MASVVKKPSGNYDAIVSMWDKKTKKTKQKRINLLTRDLNDANTRAREVEKNKTYFFDADKDYNVSFPWMNEDGELKTEEIESLLKDMAQSFLKYQKDTKGLRIKSLQSNQLALTQFLQCIKNINVKNIRLIHIDAFISHLRKKVNQKGEPLSCITINNRLRVINTFLIWMLERRLIDVKVKVNMIEEPDQDVRYISENDYNDIINHKDLTLRYRRAFKLYWETGMRLQEPFRGYIQGDWYIVPPKKSKNKKKREIRVNEEQKETILFLQELWSENPTDDAIKWYSKKFKKVLRSLNIKDRSIHCLRHSYAIRRMSQGVPMKIIAKEMGHKRTSTTDDRYTEFSLRDLAKDFPSIFDAKNNQLYTKTLYTDEGLRLAASR